MSFLRQLRFLLLPSAILAGLVLMRFAVILLQQAFHKGFGEGLMAAWVLLFVAGIPLLLLAGAATGAIGARPRKRPIVPLLGVKIP